MESGGEVVSGWSDAVEDLVDRGDVEGAISLLESVVSKLETLDSSSSSSSADVSPTSYGGSDLRLASALGDLADLHSSRGFSLKADELRSRALLIRARALRTSPPKSRDSEISDVKSSQEVTASVPAEKQLEDDDDWEAIADRLASGEVSLSVKDEEVAVSSTSTVDPPLVKPRRRGRGSFLYKKNYLYSDQPDVGANSGENSESEDELEANERPLEGDVGGVKNSKYGTGHVLVLSDFPTSTRTIDLEKLFDDFRDRGVAIRWVNDTTALAVFRTPFYAQEAQSSVRCPFKVCPLTEKDNFLTQISTGDLEPPFVRPKTSTRTAQRLIAQGMGIKLPTDFGSSELKKQEEARKNRILTRQTMKDEAWGSDTP